MNTSNKTRTSSLVRNIVCFTASLCCGDFWGSWSSWISQSFRILLSKMRRFLFLVAAGFLSVVLTACAGGGGGQ